MSRNGVSLFTLYQRHGGSCHWCNVPCAKPGIRYKLRYNHAPTRDHVYVTGDPRRHEPGKGSHDIRYVLACRACNVRRGNMSYNEFLAVMKPGLEATL